MYDDVLYKLSEPELKHVTDVVENIKKYKVADDLHCKFAHNVLQLHNVSKRYLPVYTVKIMNGGGFVTLILGGTYVYYVYPNKVVYYIISSVADQSAGVRHVTYLHINNSHDVQQCTSLCIHKEVQKHPAFYDKCVVDHLPEKGSYVISSVNRGEVLTSETVKTSLLCYAVMMSVRRGVFGVNAVDDAVFNIITVFTKAEYTEKVLYRLLRTLPFATCTEYISVTVSNTRKKKSIRIDIDTSYYITYNGRYVGLDSNVTGLYINWYAIADIMRNIDVSRMYSFYRLPVNSVKMKETLQV